MREMTSLEIREQVKKDYAKAVGKVLVTHALMGYIGDDSSEVYGPTWVRVLPGCQASDLYSIHCDGWVDPYWNVEVLYGTEQAHGLRSTWVYGISYQVMTGKYQSGLMVPSRWEAFCNWLKRTFWSKFDR